MEQNIENKDVNQIDQEKDIEGGEKDKNTVIVKPSEEMREKKINYTVIGQDVQIDPEATVIYFHLFILPFRKST